MCGGGVESLVSNIRSETSLPTPSDLFSVVLTVFARAMARTKIKEMQLGKKEKLSLLADNVILCLKNPKNTTRKHLKCMKYFLQYVQQNKKSTYKKNQSFLHTMNVPRKEIERKKIPVITA